MSTEATYSSVDLADYARIVGRRKWLILAIALLCALAAAGYAILQPPVYATSAEVQLPERNSSEGASPAIRVEDISTEVQVMQSQVVADRAAKLLGPGVDARSLSRKLKVTTPPDARVLNIRFEAANAKDAQSGANAFATAYIQHRIALAEADAERRVALQQQIVDEITNRRTLAEEELAEAQTAAEADSDNNALANREVRAQSVRTDVDRELADANRELADRKATLIDGGTLISAAPLPRRSINPGPVKNGVLGLFGGLVVGLGVAFLRERLDSQVRDSESIEVTLGVPSLGDIPMFGERYRSPSTALVTVHAPGSTEADAFRRLRASVLIAASDDDAQVLVVTSSNPGEGKTTVAANLAVSLAQAGRSVVVVSADMRRPAIDGLFDQRGLPGLGEVLEGRKHLDEVITIPKHTGFGLISSGHSTANPTDLLQSPQMARLLNTLRERYQLVIIDTPPVLAVADTVGLVQLTDGVLMVVALDETGTSDVAEAQTQLRRSGAIVLGAIVNRAELEDKRYQSYREPVTKARPRDASK